MKQKFGVGDTAILHDKKKDWKVKIKSVIQDDDGLYWYEVEPADFNSITREVPQNKLEEV